jgi:two-component system sensor histidine kinase DesK
VSASGPDAAPEPGGPDEARGPDEHLAVDELSQVVSTWRERRRRVVTVLIAVFVLSPLVGLVSKHGFSGKALFLVPAAVAFVLAIARIMLAATTGRGNLPRDARWLVVVFVLGSATFAVGGINWITTLAVAASLVGNMIPSGRPAMIGITACCAVGLAIGLWQRFGYGNTLLAAGVPALAGLLSYSAARRNDLVYRLQEARAELARMAVAEERLRISRDLHDLLGHSLSLISLKAELAGRLIGADTARAAKEIAEVETVARRSLTEVRQAVTSYRQPSLAAEVGAARRMLASAGVDCRVDMPGAYSLPPAVDALLAWTVREGTTNIVRHAAARHAEIKVTLASGHAAALLTDDGAGPGTPTGPGMPQVAAGAGAAAWTPATAAGEPRPGFGLAGLAERAARLGGTLSAGAGQRGGFRLLVSVPYGEAGTLPGETAAPPAALPTPAAHPAPRHASPAGNVEPGPGAQACDAVPEPIAPAGDAEARHAASLGRGRGRT